MAPVLRGREACHTLLVTGCGRSEANNSYSGLSTGDRINAIKNPVRFDAEVNRISADN